VIASGPTVPPAGNLDPLGILQRFCPDRRQLPDSIWRALDPNVSFRSAKGNAFAERKPTLIQHWIIGHNRTALDAAAIKATDLGYQVIDLGSDHAGIAREVGREFAEACLARQQTATQPTCLLSGGEPVVQLAETDQPRRGGRNQELALAAGIRLWEEDLSRIVVLSGGTDGEDGPTDAAGAWFDADVRRRAEESGLDPQAFLAINNTYPFFAATGGLLKTGPTDTNVMDVRVGLMGRA
jgi:hydroxypyruvate reductase